VKRESQPCVGDESWHGTPYGYRNHKCRGDDCRRAHKENHQRKRDERMNERELIDGRWTATNPKLTHGKPTTYVNWVCRCVPCTNAHAERTYRNAQRRRERKLAEARRLTMETNDTYDIVMIATRADTEIAIKNALERLGCTFADLAEMYRTGQYVSVHHRMAWAAVGRYYPDYPDW
jgi:hypothetical protein